MFQEEANAILDVIVDVPVLSYKRLVLAVESEREKKFDKKKKKGESHFLLNSVINFYQQIFG